MPKTTIYLRVAKQHRGYGAKPFKVQANPKANHAPLTDSNGDALPTVAFGITVDIPDAAFKQAEQIIADLTLPEDAFEVAADVKVRELVGALPDEGKLTDA